MQSLTSTQMTSFWVDVMDRLNREETLCGSIPEILKDSCEFFDFGCGFVYQANFANVFYLREDHVLCPSLTLSDPLDMGQVLDADALEQLAAQQVVLYGKGQDNEPLATHMAQLFAAQTLVLIPVTARDRGLIALVGMADRRGESRRVRRRMDYVRAILSAVADHVKLQLYQDRLERTQQAMSHVIDNMGVDLYVSEFYTHEILYVNQSMIQHYGSRERLLGQPCWKIMFDRESQCDFCPQLKLIDDMGQPTGTYSWERQHPKTKRYWHVLSAATRWIDGRLAHIVSSIDITENKRNEKLIRRMADYDALTGLYNRRRLMLDMEEGIRKMEGAGEHGFLLYFDLDGFKAVNDTLGHRAGDELLSGVGQRLLEGELTGDNCYRYGGDEFVVLYTSSDIGQVVKGLQYVQDCFTTPWKLNDGKASCGSSCGIAHYPYDGQSAEDLLHKADQAMYAAKQQGGNRAYFYNRGQLCAPQEYFGIHGTH